MKNNLLQILKNNYSLDTAKEIKLLRKGIDNDIYLFFSEDGEKQIARFGKRDISNSIEFEVKLINELVKYGIRTPSIIKTKDGNNFVNLSGGKVLLCFEFVEGKSPVQEGNVPKVSQVNEAARCIGEFHRATMNLDLDVSGRRTMFSELERVNELKSPIKELFKDSEEFISDTNRMLEFGQKVKFKQGIIHNDYNPTNVLFDNSDLVVIVDFDWACKGPLLIDVGYGAVTWSTEEKEIKPDWKKFNKFITSYKEIGPIRNFQKKELYFWSAYSCLYLAANFICDSVKENRYSIKSTKQSWMYKRYKYYEKLYL